MTSLNPYYFLRDPIFKHSHTRVYSFSMWNSRWLSGRPKQQDIRWEQRRRQGPDHEEPWSPWRVRRSVGLWDGSYNFWHTVVRTKIFPEGDGSHCWVWAEVAHSLGSPGGTSGKEPACQCRRHKRCGFDPWVGKIPWRRTWQPTPVFLPGESHGQRSLVGYGP